MKNIIKNNRGSAVIMLTLLMLFSMLIAVSMGSDRVVAGMRMGSAQLDSAKAYYAAEAGAEKMIWSARKNDVILEGMLLVLPCEVNFWETSATLSLINCCESANPSSRCGGTDVDHPATNGTGGTPSTITTQYFTTNDTSYTADYSYIVYPAPKPNEARMKVVGSFEDVQRRVILTW